MKTFIKQVSGVLFWGLFTFFGFMTVSASNSTKSQNLKFVSNQTVQIVQNKKVKIGEITILAEKKSNANIFAKDSLNSNSEISSKKANKSAKANATNNKINKKRTPKSRFLDKECFTDCLGRSVPPELVLQCGEACANQNYAQCAVCIGVGVYVVISCGVECFPSLD